MQADTVLDGLNRYTYCHNNPVRYVDPTGTTGTDPKTDRQDKDPGPPSDTPKERDDNDDRERSRVGGTNGSMNGTIGGTDSDPTFYSIPQNSSPTLNLPEGVKINIRSFFDKQTQTLRVEYQVVDDLGRVIDRYTNNYDMASNVRPNEQRNGPVNFNGKYNYFPEDFPEGEWDLGRPVNVENNPLMGDTFIPTNAFRDDVPTYTYNDDLRKWQQTGTVRDKGFGLHGGGSSEDPMGDNNYTDNTLGCGRMRNTNVREFSRMVNDAHNTGGTATISVY